MSSHSWSLLPQTIQSPLLLSRHKISPSLCISTKWRASALYKDKAPERDLSAKPQGEKCSQLSRLTSILHCGALLAAVEAQPALAVTGDNNYELDLVATIVSAGIVGVVYLFVCPPIIMNWLRLRWYKRKFLEMYLQFMCVFLFFPGLMLWAPFVNFRRLPRDPTMKNPWDTPKDDAPLISR